MIPPQDVWRGDVEALCRAPMGEMQRSQVHMARARLGAVWGDPRSEVLTALQRANGAAEAAVATAVCGCTV